MLDKGVRVQVSTRDISQSDETVRLVTECCDLGPLGGVFHLAMVLKDTLFENQTPDNFQQAAKMKYAGTKHLDECTRNMCGSDLKWLATCNHNVHCNVNILFANRSRSI